MLNVDRAVEESGYPPLPVGDGKGAVPVPGTPLVGYENGREPVPVGCGCRVPLFREVGWCVPLPAFRLVDDAPKLDAVMDGNCRGNFREVVGVGGRPALWGEVERDGRPVPWLWGLVPVGAVKGPPMPVPEGMVRVGKFVVAVEREACLGSKSSLLNEGRELRKRECAAVMSKAARKEGVNFILKDVA